jgi:hypothetical protein
LNSWSIATAGNSRGRLLGSPWLTSGSGKRFSESLGWERKNYTGPRKFYTRLSALAQGESAK